MSLSIATSSGKGGVSADALADVRAKVLQRNGKVGIKDIGRCLRIMDDNGSGFLDSDELRTGLRDMLGVHISDADFARISQALDANGDGTISVDEFVVGLRGPLSQRRRNVIEQAFRRMDANGNGHVDISDVRSFYDASRHPSVLSGLATPADVQLKFMAQFESGDGPSDGIVTFEEFTNYYTGVSASVDKDETFELMMIRSWSLDKAGGGGAGGGAGGPGGAAAAAGSFGRYNANHGVALPRKAFTNEAQERGPDGAVVRKANPLYTTSGSAYGSTAHNHVADAKHNRPGAFTKNAPGFSAGSSLNCSTSKSKVI